MSKGQTTVEALLILAAVLIAVTSLQVTGRNTNETNNAVSAAKMGVEKFMTELSIKYETDAILKDYYMENDNRINLSIAIQGKPPLDENNMEKLAENAALNQIKKITGEGYEVSVEITTEK